MIFLQKCILDFFFFLSGIIKWQKPLSLHILSYFLSFSSVVYEWIQFRQWKSLLWFDVIPLNNADMLFTARQCQLLVSSATLIKLLDYHIHDYVLICMPVLSALYFKVHIVYLKQLFYYYIQIFSSLLNVKETLCLSNCNY